MKRGKKLLILLLALALVGGGIWAVNAIVEANIVYMTDDSIPVVSIDTEKLTQLICSYEDSTITLKKEGSTWTYMEDPSIIPDQSVMDEALKALSNVRAEKALENAMDLAEYGLGEPPTGSITAVTDSETVVLYLGNETAFGEQRYVTVDHNKVYIIRDLDFFNRLPMYEEDLHEYTVPKS